MRIFEFILEKSRSFVLIKRFNENSKLKVRIVEFILVKSRSAVLIVTRSSQIIAASKDIEKYTLEKRLFLPLVKTKKPPAAMESCMKHIFQPSHKLLSTDLCRHKDVLSEFLTQFIIGA